MWVRKPPRVSIGLPVFNGENFVSSAIESILAQTFGDLELIISDNASTDSTEAICREHAKRDSRIRYYRNARNIGAAANFNRVFELASAEYFKWAAHDDALAPEFLERGVAALDGDPDAVLWYPMVREIGPEGGTILIARSRLTGANAQRPPERFGAVVLKVETCREIFGLIRSVALRRTGLHKSYEGEDKALLAELALLGRFIEAHEPLFLHREHPGRFVHVTRDRDELFGFKADECVAWYDPDSAAGQRAWHTWTRYTAYFRMVRRHISEPRERLRCYGHLLRWLGVKWNLRFLAMEAVAAVDPRPLLLLRAAKRRLSRLWQARDSGALGGS